MPSEFVSEEEISSIVCYLEEHDYKLFAINNILIKSPNNIIFIPPNYLTPNIFLAAYRTSCSRAKIAAMFNSLPCFFINPRSSLNF